ncbi:ThiJ/PfpI [Pseudomonas sp. S37]|uniref:DJ-1/PfpI family protein n=1 Tax=Pseudomonas sp. S37 TaxID=2767449 RepID=UPI001914581A|nr:DJ-1/PfpI family protein [Pseudomonas sp. S37]MBK4993425.1 ThiJ/PfpI [Pseudomonas sp. S37]
MARVALLLTPGFADWEYALIAGTGAPFYGLELDFFAPSPGQFRSQGGLAVTVDHDLLQCLAWQPDVVAVIGGLLWEGEQAPDLGSFLQACHTRGATLAGICGGTLALARAGLLDTVAHTSNNPQYLQQHAANYAGQARYQSTPAAVVAERIITAPGPAPVSFTCAVLQAAGVAQEAVGQFRSMLAAEHA